MTSLKFFNEYFPVYLDSITKNELVQKKYQPTPTDRQSLEKIYESVFGKSVAKYFEAKIIRLFGLLWPPKKAADKS